MRILISGGVGFIGTNLSIRLLDLGHEVIAIDNLITGNPENLSYLRKYSKFTFLNHAIVRTLPDKLRKLKIDRIYHLACPTGVPNLKILAEEMLLTCSVGTINILELARLNNAILLFTSSAEVYGDPQVTPQAESYTGNVDSIGFRSPYEEGKRFSESLLKMYVSKYKLRAKIARVFNTYGPMMSDKDTRVIPTFLRQAQNGLPLTVQGKGTQLRTFCYVDDLVDGLILMMEKGKSGEAYNLGSNKQVSILDLAKMVIRLVPNCRSQIKFIPRPKHDHQSRLPSLEKSKKLGFRLKTPLEKGLKLTLGL